MCVCAARVVGVFVTTFDLFRILDCALLLSLSALRPTLSSPRVSFPDSYGLVDVYCARIPAIRRRLLFFLSFFFPFYLMDASPSTSDLTQVHLTFSSSSQLTPFTYREK